MAAAATPGAEAPPAQPLLALCVAAEARVGRGPQLLACVPGTELLVAAAGSHLLVLRAGTGGMRPAEMLLTAAASIAAVAVYSSSSGGSGGGGSGSGGQRWAAALAGGTAHVVPVDLGSSGASDAGSVSFEASGRKLDWHSCAWHPAQAVCAVVAPQQLLLVSPVRPQPAGGEGGSGSSAAEGGSGDVSSRVLAAVPFPGCGSTATCAAAGRCCVAWLGGGGGGGRRGGTVWRVAVSQGPNLELLTFDSGTSHGCCTGCLHWWHPACSLPSSARMCAAWRLNAMPRCVRASNQARCRSLLLLLLLQTGSCWSGVSSWSALPAPSVGWQR